MVFYVPEFGIFWLHKIADNSNAGFSVQIEGVYVFWLQVVHVDEGV